MENWSLVREFGLFMDGHSRRMLILFFAYAGVLAAMACDLVAGVWKARQRGEARTSRGYKMTAEKAGKYFLPMVCLTAADFITADISPAPVFTMVMAGWNIFCEVRSVLESTREKAELRDAANTMRVVLQNKDDLARAIAALLGQADGAKGGKENKGNATKKEEKK